MGNKGEEENEGRKSRGSEGNCGRGIRENEGMESIGGEGKLRQGK